MTKDKFAELCRALRTMKSGIEWTADVQDAYLRVFQKVPNPIVDVMINAILVHFEWRPSIAEIVNLMREIMRDGDGASCAAALQEVHRFRATLGKRCVQSGTVTAVDMYNRREIATYKNMIEGTPAFSDPHTTVVIEAMGGWPQFCDMADSTPVTIWQGQFMKLYEATAKQDGSETLKKLRLEWREQVAGLLSAEAPLLPMSLEHSLYVTDSTEKSVTPISRVLRHLTQNEGSPAISEIQKQNKNEGD